MLLAPSIQIITELGFVFTTVVWHSGTVGGIRSYTHANSYIMLLYYFKRMMNHKCFFFHTILVDPVSMPCTFEALQCLLLEKPGKPQSYIQGRCLKSFLICTQ